MGEVMKPGKICMKLGLLGLLFCFIAIKGAYGSAVPSNAELFGYIKELQATVKEQAERIKTLEMCYGECKLSIERHEESLVQLKKIPLLIFHNK
jgi:hypothetical protein